MSRNSQLFRSLLRFNLHQWRSFSSSTSSHSPSYSSHLPSSFWHRSLPFLNTVILRDQDFKTSRLYKRYFSTASSSSGGSSSNVDAQNSEAKNSSDSNSGDGAKSEGSQQSGDAGKSIRGSPVSWMSLFLLLVTGAGIIYYYDQEKKRHIEGRLLW